MNREPLYGLMVEFDSAADILRATRSTWQARYRRFDAYTPYPVEGLARGLGLRHSRIPSIVFIGGLVGGASGFLMQYWMMAVDYPLNVGGRPLNSWPAFIPITFELLVLLASFAAFIGMLFFNGLPKFHHPVFNVPGFDRASQDRFFLCIEAADPQFDLQATARFLAEFGPLGDVIEVPAAPPSFEPAEQSIDASLPKTPDSSTLVEATAP